MRLKIVDGEWQEAKPEDKDAYYIDGILKTNLDGCKKVIKKDWDYIFIVDGEVGSGKSVFAQRCAAYCYPKLDVSCVCFEGDEFKKKIASAERYSAVIFDEAFRGLSARAALSMMNKSIVEMLNEIRQKNLFVFIVTPSTWDLDPYVKLHRAKGLFHVYTMNERERGFFRFYKNNDWYKHFFSKSDNKYKYPNLPDFKGAFTDGYFVDEKEYKKKKLYAMQNLAGLHDSTQKSPDLLKRDLILKYNANMIKLHPEFKTYQRAAILGIGAKTLISIENGVLERPTAPPNLPSEGDENAEYV